MEISVGGLWKFEGSVEIGVWSVESVEIVGESVEIAGESVETVGESVVISGESVEIGGESVDEDSKRP